MLPDEMDVTSRSPVASRVPVKPTDTGAIELSVVVAAASKLAFSAFWISAAAAEKQLTPERLTDPEYMYPPEVMDSVPLIACNCASVRFSIFAP